MILEVQTSLRARFAAGGPGAEGNSQSVLGVGETRPSEGQVPPETPSPDPPASPTQRSTDRWARSPPELSSPRAIQSPRTLGNNSVVGWPARCWSSGAATASSRCPPAPPPARPRAAPLGRPQSSERSRGCWPVRPVPLDGRVLQSEGVPPGLPGPFPRTETWGLLELGGALLFLPRSFQAGLRVKTHRPGDWRP